MIAGARVCCPKSGEDSQGEGGPSLQDCICAFGLQEAPLGRQLDMGDVLLVVLVSKVGDGPL